MIETGALKQPQWQFENPFDTHTLCVEPFLKTVKSARELPSLIAAFREFDGSEVSPRVRKDRQRIHHAITHPMSLFILGVNELGARQMGMPNNTIETLNQANDLLKRLKRRSAMAKRIFAAIGGTLGDPYGDHPKRELTTSQRGDKSWQIDVEKTTYPGPLSSCDPDA